MTHSDTPGTLLSVRGHTLTVDEGHAIVFGSIGFLAGSIDEVTKPIVREPHYVVGAFLVSWLLGRSYAQYADRQEGDDS